MRSGYWAALLECARTGSARLGCARTAVGTRSREPNAAKNPATGSVKLRYLEEFLGLSKILPDSVFSDLCRLEVSRVLAETFSTRRNRCSNLEFFEKWSF